jgi:hypothetical protein
MGSREKLPCLALLSVEEAAGMKVKKKINYRIKTLLKVTLTTERNLLNH